MRQGGKEKCDSTPLNFAANDGSIVPNKYFSDIEK